MISREHQADIILEVPGKLNLNMQRLCYDFKSVQSIMETLVERLRSI